MCRGQWSIVYSGLKEWVCAKKKKGAPWWSRGWDSALLLLWPGFCLWSGNSHKVHSVPEGKRVACEYNLVKNLGEHSDSWSWQCSGGVRR